MKNFRGFILYGVILFLLIISTLIVYIIENTSLNRLITENYDREYQNYLDCYSLILENLEEKDKVAERVYNYKYRGKASTIFSNNGKSFIASKNSDNTISLNVFDGIKNSYTSVLYIIPKIFYSSRPYILIEEFEKYNIPNEFKEELFSGEKLQLIYSQYMSQNSFFNKNIKITYDSRNVNILDEDTNKKVSISNADYSYIHFNGCKIKIIPNKFYSLKPLIVSDGDIEFESIGETVTFRGLILTTGNIENNNVNLNGKIIANSITNLDIINEKQNTNFNFQMLENIRSLYSFDIKSFH